MLDRRTLIKGIAAAALMVLPTSATAEEVIDPKLTALFGEDWASHKVTLGDSVEAWEEVFGDYFLGDTADGKRYYHIEDVAHVGIDVEETGQVSGITVFPFNTAFNTNTEKDTRLWTDAQAKTVYTNFMPDDSEVTQICPDLIGGVEIMGYSEELYDKVLPETYVGTQDETPTQGEFSVQVFAGLFNEPVAKDDPRKVECVSIALEAWELSC